MPNLLDEAQEYRFAPELEGTPYSDSEEHLRDMLSLASLYLTVAGVFRIGTEGPGEPSLSAVLPGSALDAQEALDYLGDYPDDPTPQDEEVQGMLAASWRHLESRVRATPDEMELLRLERVRRILKLDDFAYLALVCSLGCAVDRGFERVFAALHGEKDLPCPTVGTMEAVWRMGGRATLQQLSQLGDRSLAGNFLLYQSPGREWPMLLQPLYLRPEILAYLTGRSCLTGPWSRCCQALDPAGPEETLFLEGPCREIGLVLDAAQRDPAARLTVLCGSRGSGRRSALRRLARERNVRFLLADLAELEMDGRGEAAYGLLACGLLEGYRLCFSLEREEERPKLMELLRLLAPHRLPVFVLTDSMRGGWSVPDYRIHRVDYPPLDLQQALDLWLLLARRIPVRQDLRWEEIAAKYQLTPGQMREVLQNAMDTLPEDGELGAREVESAILLGNTNRLNEIADPIPVFYGWDDLVLAEEPKELLRSVCSRVRHKHQVETVWGWEGKRSYGKGLSVLLYGPPGTGKTMCAQVLAGELHLPLFRINLAQIISKYIGETAKNLDVVFREAKNSNVILFFDEADALFAKRTDVKDSNDRHANSESAYLLQKIEEYSGVCILATNLAHNFDEAFRRRIGYIVNIPMPSAEQRKNLWQKCYPAAAPLASDVDFGLLAEKLEFSGSVIKSAAVQSAYFAADEGSAVSMRHIARAVRLELRKLGKSEPDFVSIYLRKTT